MRLHRLLPVLLLLPVMGVCAERESSAQEASTMSVDLFAALDSGWNTVRPGGDTTCSLGTEFAFFVRPAATGRLLVYFQGGGACWNAETCDPEGRPTYSLDVDDTDNPVHRQSGIFDLKNSDNPLRQHSMVMVPYCTGDVHMGDVVANYTVEDAEAGPRDVTVHHRGYTNATAALEWVYAHFPALKQIVVAGSSAGSIPSPFYAHVLASRYPEADILALGDAAGSYRRDPATEEANPARSWNMLDVVQRHPGYEDFDATTLDFADLYIVTGQQDPDIRLLQFDAAWDGVQKFFLDLAYEGEPQVRDLIAENRAEIRAAIADFRGYLAGGREHTILFRDAFYSYEVGGSLFRDWLHAAISGEALDDVECDDCGRAEIHLTERDVRIVERALETLADEASWSRADDGICNIPGAAAVSLRCALLGATDDMDRTTSRESGALLEARFEVLDRLGTEAIQGPPLVAFNNRPETSFVDVRELLATVAERAREHTHD